MERVISLFWDDFGKITLVLLEGYDEPHHIDDVELLQFIGRRDRNGEELYKGDLIRDGGNRILEVFWNEFVNGWWFAEYRADGVYHVEGIDLTSIEKVGNIFENRNLLGVTPDA